MASIIDQPAIRTEPEITGPVDLCDRKGDLNRPAVGFSRTPLHRCNLKGHPLRKKRWNYWAVMSERYVFSATIADIDYLGLASVYLIDFQAQRMVGKDVVLPFGGRPMPETVHADIRFKHDRLRILIEDDGQSLRMRAKAPSVKGEQVRADIAISRPTGHETLNVVIPWSGSRFQFTSKQSALPASGAVQLGGEEFVFEEGSSFAVLDYGRGVWPVQTFWNWGAGSGVQDGRVVGLNLGGGWTDGTGMTENGLTIDGVLHKIHEDLRFDYDTSDFMKPWLIRSIGSDRIDLRLDPIFERAAKTDLLLLKSDVHQVFGRYSGTVRDDAGTPVAIDGLMGWVEQQDARW
jgi:hypothetical protein